VGVNPSGIQAQELARSRKRDGPAVNDGTLITKKLRHQKPSRFGTR
jgi:hypothetical protein